MKNLIYFSVFGDIGYGDLLLLLLKSLKLKGSFNPETTDLLLLTNPSMADTLREKVATLGFQLNMMCINITGTFDAAAARLYLFKYPNISYYNTILYVDADILVTSNINTLFDLPIESGIIYGPEDCTLDSYFHGRQFYSDPPQVDLTQPAFCSGILLFKNCPEISNLFEETLKHIYVDIVVNRNNIPGCLEQPYLVYNAAIRKMYNAKLLNTYIRQGGVETIEDGVVLCHFCGDIGNSNPKKIRMETFFRKNIGFNLDTLIT